MSTFAPVIDSDNGSPQTKFAEMTIYADGPHTAKNGKQYYKFEFNIVPWIDGDNPPDDANEFKVKTWKTNNGPWNAEFKQFWSSICIEAHDASGAKNWALLPAFQQALKTPDDLFAPFGQPAKVWLVSYQTPVFLIEAKPDDLKYAQDNNRFGMLQKNDIGQWMKKTYPVKLLNIYTDRAIWEADAKKNAVSKTKTTSAPASSPDMQAALAALPTIIKASNFNLNTLATILNSNPAFIKLGLTADSDEVKHAVASEIIKQIGSTDHNAIKGMLLSLNGGAYLDFFGPEIQSLLAETPF